IPDKERSKLLDRFNQYFQWPKEDQDRVLGRLPENERQEMQNTLDAFERLTPDQRRSCISAFNKFTQMKPQARDLFIKNAARWSAMTQEERNTWKSLVNDLPPLPTEAQLPPWPESDSAATNSSAR